MKNTAILDLKCGSYGCNIKVYCTLAGVGSSLFFPRKSADSQTGPTTSNVEVSVSGAAGEINSICCNQQNEKETVASLERRKSKMVWKEAQLDEMYGYL